MAEIFAFPADAPLSQRTGINTAPRPDGVPDAVWSAVESVRTMPRVNGMQYREIAVPASLADYGIGVGLTCDQDSHAMPSQPAARAADGWIMLLYAHEPPVQWQSHWRCVAYARMPLPALEDNGLTPAMYWDDMCDRLVDIDPDSISGTVTVTRDTTFAAPTETGSSSLPVANRADCGCEMRVSWTPIASIDGVLDAGGQIQLWARFIHAAYQEQREQEDSSVDR